MGAQRVGPASHSAEGEIGTSLRVPSHQSGPGWDPTALVLSCVRRAVSSRRSHRDRPSPSLLAKWGVMVAAVAPLCSPWHAGEGTASWVRRGPRQAAAPQAPIRGHARSASQGEEGDLAAREGKGCLPGVDGCPCPLEQGVESSGCCFLRPGPCLPGKGEERQHPLAGRLQLSGAPMASVPVPRLHAQPDGLDCVGSRVGAGHGWGPRQGPQAPGAGAPLPRSATGAQARGQAPQALPGRP